MSGYLDKSEAWRQGRLDFNGGVRKSSNPYRTHPERTDWAEGWDYAASRVRVP